VRAAKGYDINGLDLSYKVNDQFKAQTNARSNQQVIFFDSEGKVYSLPGHALPSARGQGEPLTSKLNPADGAVFETLIGGEPTEWVLLASDAGYGFITQISELFVKNRNGKVCLKLPENSRILSPRLTKDKEEKSIACVTNIGRLLVFSALQIPILSKGKGNKLINISASKFKKREEYVIDMQFLNEGDSLIVHAGKRHYTLKPADLEKYRGERARRGNCLPRGLQNVTSLEINSAESDKLVTI
jgi:topoisomerase-4 subunit A